MYKNFRGLFSVMYKNFVNKKSKYKSIFIKKKKTKKKEKNKKLIKKEKKKKKKEN